jgi:hypothetical protein
MVEEWKTIVGCTCTKLQFKMKGQECLVEQLCKLAI